MGAISKTLFWQKLREMAFQFRHLLFILGNIAMIAGTVLIESISTGFRPLYIVGGLLISFSFYDILVKDGRSSSKIAAIVVLAATIGFIALYNN